LVKILLIINKLGKVAEFEPCDFKSIHYLTYHFYGKYIYFNKVIEKAKEKNNSRSNYYKLEK